MNATFRLRRLIQVAGIAFTLIFSAITVGFVTWLLLLKEPEKEGFDGEHSVAIVGGLCVTVLGGMTIFSMYTLAAYYVERLVVAGTTIQIRSVFQKREFVASEVDKLEWKIAPIAGRLVFLASGQKTRLDLHGFHPQDRLQIIRLLRNLIPDDKQEGWPLFCMKIGLPLRDGVSSKSGARSVMAAESPAGEVLITRRRYDRLFAVLFPISLIAAAVVSLAIAWPPDILLPIVATASAVPILIFAFWLFLRFTIPPEGKRIPKVTGSYDGRTMLFGLSAVVAARLTMAAVRFTGVNREDGCLAGLMILTPVLPIVMYRLFRSDKAKKMADAVVAATATERWEQGESSREP